MTSETEQIQLLEDTNGDGKADKSTVFADGFGELTSGIASGVLANHGDIYFTCIPDLWRLRDTDGDGKADQREVLQHGYAVRFGFYGHDLHGLRIGPDGKLYFSIGDRGLNVLTKEGKRVAAPECGAVMRCNLDGSNLELFAIGLRNPQELAFDEFGNLFTGDNNSDGGDQARFVYLLEGADNGWRQGFQFINRPVPRGPWNAEKMWYPANDEQPAFLVPPLANLANGPSGLTYAPGTGLPPELAHQFFLADFKGVSALSLVHSFGLQPKGAAFEVVNRRPFLSNILVTDVDFGTDGSLYVSDWVEGWGKTGKGRIYRVFNPQYRGDALASRTQEYLARGMTQRSAVELIDLLGFADQRVRQAAQFELADRGLGSITLLARLAANSTANQLARLHAIWALGQIYARSGSAEPLDEAIKPVVALLQDSDAEVRAQSAKVLGDARYDRARRSLLRLATDTKYPRAQFFAVMALGKIGGGGATDAVLRMLRENADRDPYLRHAGVMALYWLNDKSVLEKSVADSSPGVRMAALLALRRMASPVLARCLHDAEPRIVLEAARAISDLPIESALPALAKLAEQPITSSPLLRRVINANYRLGTSANAVTLAKLAADYSTLEAGRAEALRALETWEHPSGRDNITGLWRPLPERSGFMDALQPMVAQVISDSSGELQALAARLAGKYQFRDLGSQLTNLAETESADARARSEALRTLAAFEDPHLVSLLNRVVTSKDEMVRKTAQGLLAKLDPSAAVPRLAEAVKTGSASEQQAAWLTLKEIESDQVDDLLVEGLGRLQGDKLEPAAKLELLEAAAKRKSSKVQEKLKAFEESRPKGEVGRYQECLMGGDASEGRRIFFEKVEASCVRCHKIGGEGGEAGPVLDRPDMNRKREYLLESIVSPNKVISTGFETVTVFLKNEDVHSGIVKSETDQRLVLISPDAGEVTIAKADIDLRRTGLSGMPEGIMNLLSKRDLRDLVEFLSNPTTP
jgi:quinoprotein glucose dehydrogenase